MIMLTDSEQATALRCARYAFASLEKRSIAGDEQATKEMPKVLDLIAVLEQENTLARNGLWRCDCWKKYRNPWHQPTDATCEKCGKARP